MKTVRKILMSAFLISNVMMLSCEGAMTSFTEKETGAPVMMNEYLDGEVFSDGEGDWDVESYSDEEDDWDEESYSDEEDDWDEESYSDEEDDWDEESYSDEEDDWDEESYSDEEDDWDEESYSDEEDDWDEDYDDDGYYEDEDIYLTQEDIRKNGGDAQVFWNGTSTASASDSGSVDAVSCRNFTAEDMAYRLGLSRVIEDYGEYKFFYEGSGLADEEYTTRLVCSEYDLDEPGSWDLYIVNDSGITVSGVKVGMKKKDIRKNIDRDFWEYEDEYELDDDYLEITYLSTEGDGRVLYIRVLNNEVEEISYERLPEGGE